MVCPGAMNQLIIRETSLWAVLTSSATQRENHGPRAHKEHVPTLDGTSRNAQNTAMIRWVCLTGARCLSIDTIKVINGKWTRMTQQSGIQHHITTSQPSLIGQLLWAETWDNTSAPPPPPPPPPPPDVVCKAQHCPTFESPFCGGASRSVEPSECGTICTFKSSDFVEYKQKKMNPNDIKNDAQLLPLPFWTYKTPTVSDLWPRDQQRWLLVAIWHYTLKVNSQLSCAHFVVSLRSTFPISAACRWYSKQRGKQLNSVICEISCWQCDCSSFGLICTWDWYLDQENPSLSCLSTFIYIPLKFMTIKPNLHSNQSTCQSPGPVQLYSWWWRLQCHIRCNLTTQATSQDSQQTPRVMPRCSWQQRKHFVQHPSGGNSPGSWVSRTDHELYSSGLNEWFQCDY